MENYEEKYKKALGWMCSIYPTMRGADKEDAEHYFPELKESENEKIRKKLIDFLEYYRLNNVLNSNTISLLTDSVAWLEKQGEQNKTIKPQTHWKPSEEQMQALIKRTQGLHTNSETRKVLESLIFDLQEKL